MPALVPTSIGSVDGGAMVFGAGAVRGRTNTSFPLSGSRMCRRGPHKRSLRRVCRSLFPLVSEDSTTQWIHAATFGEFNGHPAGAFTLDAQAFEQIVANFNARENKAIPLTFDHPIYDGNPVELAGWVHDLDVRDDGLWALAEFTDKAAELVAGGSYKFCSVVIDLESVDARSGDEIGVELHELAICASPFIDGLSPIELTEYQPRADAA